VIFKANASLLLQPLSSLTNIKCKYERSLSATVEKQQVTHDPTRALIQEGKYTVSEHLDPAQPLGCSYIPSAVPVPVPVPVPVLSLFNPSYSGTPR